MGFKVPSYAHVSESKYENKVQNFEPQEIIKMQLLLLLSWTLIIL